MPGFSRLFLPLYLILRLFLPILVILRLFPQLFHGLFLHLYVILRLFLSVPVILRLFLPLCPSFEVISPGAGYSEVISRLFLHVLLILKLFRGLLIPSFISCFAITSSCTGYFMDYFYICKLFCGYFHL